MHTASLTVIWVSPTLTVETMLDQVGWGGVPYHSRRPWTITFCTKEKEKINKLKRGDETKREIP